jgi:hypothetical protein
MSDWNSYSNCNNPSQNGSSTYNNFYVMTNQHQAGFQASPQQNYSPPTEVANIGGRYRTTPSLTGPPPRKLLILCRSDLIERVPGSQQSTPQPSYSLAPIYPQPGYQQYPPNQSLGHPQTNLPYCQPQPIPYQTQTPGLSGMANPYMSAGSYPGSSPGTPYCGASATSTPPMPATNATQDNGYAFQGNGYPIGSGFPPMDQSYPPQGNCGEWNPQDGQPWLNQM